MWNKLNVSVRKKPMKKWIISVTISAFISCLGLGYFIDFMAQNGCLDSGGRWLGHIHGCDGGSGYSMQYLASPIAITLFFAIVIAISSALVQLYAILSGPYNEKTQNKIASR